MIHEILLSVVSDNPDEAHEAIVQMAESRGSSVEEVVTQHITHEEEDEIDGFCVQGRLTPGVTT